MFGFFSNSISAGERPSIKQTITADNLVATIPPTTVWYDFSSTATGYMTVSGSAISTIVDRTGGAHNATKGGTVNWKDNAAGTLTAADLSASGGQFVATGTDAYTKSLTGMSVIVVGKPVNAAATQYFSATEQGDLSIFYTGGTWKVICAGGTGTPVTSIPLNTATWQVFSFVYDGTPSLSNAQKLRFRYNKADVALTISGTVGTTTNSSNATMNWFVKNPGEASTNGYRGYVGEILLFNKALTPGQVSAVETYLGNKWGI
jgi:hypothetical protein